MAAVCKHSLGLGVVAMVAALILALSMPAAVQAQTAAPALAPSSDVAQRMQEEKAFVFIVGRLSDAIEKRKSFLCTHRFGSAFLHLRFSIRVSGKGKVFLTRQLVFLTNHGYVYIAPVCSGGYHHMLTNKEHSEIGKEETEEKKMSPNLQLSLLIFGTIGSMLLESVSCKTVHVVGDQLGWNIPSRQNFFDEWAKKKTFVVGDQLGMF
ncbi:hypothetical protein V8G54_003238 [Vigna mungo]|uniref:Phytocyanin domain-containing protein n=1 Tax=Vigna mungo TaxID=3915 RepID=A0AAQ3SDX6_VIGMU